MAGDSDVVHETEPHEASFNGFWTFTKWGTVAVALITILVVFIITR
jgi:Bacterial aa3 type cytochrome c oxidase subunit IV